MCVQPLLISLLHLVLQRNLLIPFETVFPSFCVHHNSSISMSAECPLADLKVSGLIVCCVCPIILKSKSILNILNRHQERYLILFHSTPMILRLINFLCTYFYLCLTTMALSKGCSSKYMADPFPLLFSTSSK